MSNASEKHLFANLDAIADRATEIRHDLHRHPEIGYEEVRTCGVICNELSKLGIEHTKGWGGGTGVVGLIRGKAQGLQSLGLNRDTPCVALRADIDALPIVEESSVSYASAIPGKMHACGHDGHAAVLLGAAAVLQENTHRFGGIVKLIFQPAEEGLLGAEKMVQEGCLENPKVGAIFGLHGLPGLKVGAIATRPGAMCASIDGFTIVISGKGGHAAAPHETFDPVVCAAAMVQSMQTIVSREADPTDPCVVTVASIQTGSAFNVIPDKAELKGAIRALSQSRRAAAIASLQRIAKNVAEAHRCQVSFQFNGSTPYVHNNAEMAELVHQTAVAALGEQSFEWTPKPQMWSEDFSFYLEKVPGCFFIVGVCPHSCDHYPMLHNPKYDFTDLAVPVGIRMMTELAIRYLEPEFTL
ncbi:MAG: M20 family metallopeptidase [Phycisphaerales bacterium]|nr:M20 family metallopeptidase [Phycisphaerales bacterium]